MRKLRLTLFHADGSLTVRLDEAENPATGTSAQSVLSGAEIERLTSCPPHEISRDLGRLAFPETVARPLSGFLEQGPVTLFLCPEDSESAAMPWEFARMESLFDGPLVLHPRLSIVRDGASSTPFSPRPFERRVLIALADPGSAEHLPLPFGEAELRSVELAFAAPELREWRVELLRYATPYSLTRALAERPPDVLHFIGHGGLQGTGGSLILEGGRKRSEQHLYVEDIVAPLRSAGTALVVLSACWSAGARGSFGAELAAAGVPAVVGMQRPVSEASCQLFARAFYAALSEASTVEEAVRQGRAATSGTEMDWGCPVLMRNAAIGSLSADRASTQGVLAEPTEGRPRHNLLPAVGTFIGRTKDVAAINRRIAERRLVSIVAIGGMGKTRLANEIALGQVDKFPDGVWLVECDSLVTRDEIVAAIGAAVTGEARGGASEAELARLLAERSTLLVLDCFEQLVRHTQLLTGLLRSCPGVRMLVTTRVVLGSSEESVYELHPLERGKSPSARSEGIQLFMLASKNAAPGLRFTAEERKVAYRIVEDLEAVPLALLLAAGRLRHMGIRDLADRLRDQRMETLRRRPAGDRDRHAGLQRVIEDSLRLLDERERALCKSLSVFRGGFFLEDASAVLPDFPDLIDALATLRDHSILLAQRMRGRMRFRFLDTVRECLDQWSEPADFPSVVRRHADHCARLAHSVRTRLQSGSWQEGRESLWLDMGNFRAATRFAAGGGDDDLVSVLAWSLARPYFEAGLRTEFLELAAAAERAAMNLADDGLRIELLGLKGAQARRDGDSAGARTAWEARVNLCRSLGDVTAAADTLIDLADLASANQEPTILDDVLRRFDAFEISDPKMLSSRLLVEARYRLRSGDPDGAQALARRAAAEHEKVPRDRQALFVWSNLATVYRESGASTESEAMCAMMIEESLRRGYFQSAGRGILDLALLFLRSDETVRTARCLAAAHLIPKSVSPELTRECDELRARLRHRQAGALELADQAARGVPWQELALQLAAPQFASGSRA